MLLAKKYDEESKTQEAWFDSSMVIYSKMHEDESTNTGDLYITYKGGATYVYHGVKFEDYTVFIAGGTDGSHGKSINKIIKGKYEFEKLEPMSVEDINAKLEAVLEEQRKAKEELECNPVAKWEKLKDKVKAILEYMEGKSDVTEDEYQEMCEYLSNMFGIPRDI